MCVEANCPHLLSLLENILDKEDYCHVPMMGALSKYFGDLFSIAFLTHDIVENEKIILVRIKTVESTDI